MLSFNFGNSCKFFILASSPSFLYLPTSVGHTLLPDPASMHHSVHPHIRGAYMGRPAKIYVKNGSSPPTWGIRDHGHRHCPVGRFIPTYVGHTAHWSCWPGPFSVHPHIRGAYAFRVASRSFSSGSSPPTWGIRPSRKTSCCSCRFIPTYVGHTRAITDCVRQAAVHPHIRGAY